MMTLTFGHTLPSSDRSWSARDDQPCCDAQRFAAPASAASSSAASIAVANSSAVAAMRTRSPTATTSGNGEATTGGPDPRRFEPMVDGAEVPDNRLIFAAALAPRATEVLDRCAIADQRARPDRRYPVGQWLGGGDQEIGAADQALLIRQRLLANILEAAQQIEAVVNYGAAW